MALNKEQILAIKDVQIEEVAVPEWGGTVFVKAMTGEERDTFEQSIVDKKQKGKVNLDNVRAKLCAMAICDEKGERLFSDKEVFALSKKSAIALTRIFTVAQKLNGLDEVSQGEIKENFLSDQKEDSISD